MARRWRSMNSALESIPQSEDVGAHRRFEQNGEVAARPTG